MRGFTLVELMAVVAIVGILSVIGVMAYRKVILSSKITEAQNVISAIRIAEEDHRTETGSYVGLGTTFCPSDGKQKAKYAWNPSCSGGTGKWSALAVHVDGPVLFGYRVAAGDGTVTDPFSTGVTFPSGNTLPWYIVHAQADLDGDGTTCTELTGTSFTNQIFTKNEGD